VTEDANIRSLENTVRRDFRQAMSYAGLIN